MMAPAAHISTGKIRPESSHIKKATRNRFQSGISLSLVADDIRRYLRDEPVLANQTPSFKNY